MIFKLNIQLSYLSPAIERTILFDGQTTFGQLHDVIQCAFGWENSHIHDFKVETEEGENVVNLFGNKMKSIITNPDMVFDAIIEPYNEAKEIIADWFNGERDEIEYLYDPGDDWLHTIKLMKVLEGRKECPEIIELSYFAPEEDSRSEWPEDEWMESGNHEVPDQETEEMLMSEKNGMMWSQRFRLGPADLFIDNIWDNLLTETTRFKAAAPWKALNSDDIIAIKHPEMEKMLYCSVMGALGEMYGMAVYQGDEGLQSLLGVLEGTEDGLNQKCLMLSFDNRNDLTNRDYRLIKDAGHTFRGKNAWPLFRSFRPGYYPWHIEPEEAAELMLAMEQVIEVVREYEEPSEGRVFARIPTMTNEGAEWKSKMIDFEYTEVEKEVQPLPFEQIRQVQAAARQMDDVLEIDVRSFPEPVQDQKDERPHFPILYVAFSQRMGMIADHKMIHFEEESDLPQMIIDYFQKTGYYPKQMNIQSERAYNAIAGIEQTMGIEVKEGPLQNLNGVLREMGML